MSKPTFDDLVERLQDCVIFNDDDWNKYVKASAHKLPAASNYIKHQSTRIWLLCMKNATPDRLKRVGTVMKYYSDEFAIPLRHIRELGFSELFGLGGNVTSQCSRPTGRELNWRPPLNQWADLAEFREFLSKLRMQLAHRLKSLAMLTRDANAVNFYGSDSNWEGWFFDQYNMRGVELARIIGRIVKAGRDDCNVVRDQISHSKYADMFYGTDPVESIPEPVPAALAPAFPLSIYQKDVMAYFTRGPSFYTRPDVEPNTIAIILQKVVDTPIMKVLNCPSGPGSVMKFCESNPLLSIFVGIALIRSDNCTPYTEVEHRGSQTDTRNIIQFKENETLLCKKAVRPIIESLGLKELANFLGPASKKDKNWRHLFSGCNVEEVRGFLIKEGKTPAELGLWDTKTLIEQVAIHCDKIAFFSGRQYEYKLRVLRYLRSREVSTSRMQRVNDCRVKMLPWLDSDELLAWLNPATTPKPVDVMDISDDEDEDETEPSQIDGLFKSAKVNAPQFVIEFKRQGFAFEDLPLVLDGFNDPELATIRAMLTLPQKLAIKRAWQTGGH